MRKKSDCAPLLRWIVKEMHMKPSDVFECINHVAPGAVRRRTVDCWLAEPSASGSRPCESQWVALLCYGMSAKGTIKLEEQENIRGLMNELVLAADNHANELIISPLGLQLHDQSMRFRELRQMRRLSSTSSSVNAIRKMAIRVSNL